MPVWLLPATPTRAPAALGSSDAVMVDTLLMRPEDADDLAEVFATSSSRTFGRRAA